jgi:hypothetical protein
MRLRYLGSGDLRGDASCEEDAAGRAVLEREVSGLRSVDRDEEGERLPAEPVTTRDAEAADDRRAVLG